MGRPSKYTPRLAAEICRRLAEGEALRAICRAEGMPHEATVRSWARDDVEGFATRYARARELGYLLMADELLDIADNADPDLVVRYDDAGKPIKVVGEAVQRSRLRVDTRKWMLAKMLPKVYGDRVEPEPPAVDFREMLRREAEAYNLFGAAAPAGAAAEKE